jgi:hypothetical protein
LEKAFERGSGKKELGKKHFKMALEIGHLKKHLGKGTKRHSKKEHLEKAF